MILPLNKILLNELNMWDDPRLFDLHCNLLIFKGSACIPEKRAGWERDAQIWGRHIEYICYSSTTAVAARGGKGKAAAAKEAEAADGENRAACGSDGAAVVQGAPAASFWWWGLTSSHQQGKE